MPEMTSKPQVIHRTIKRSFNYSIGEWMPELTYDDPAGWWKRSGMGSKLSLRR